MATNTTKSTKKNVTEVDLSKMEKAVAAMLKGQPKVRLMMAPDEKNPTWRGWINGYPIAFPKGKMIEVPQTIAEMIEQSTAVAKEAAAIEDKLVKGMEL